MLQGKEPISQLSNGIHRGFYRSSKGKWYHPDGCAPAGSALSKTVGVMKSPMHLNRKGSHFETKVQVPGNLEPVMLGCSIVLPGIVAYDLYFSGGH